MNRVYSCQWQLAIKISWLYEIYHPFQIKCLIKLISTNRMFEVLYKKFFKTTDLQQSTGLQSMCVEQQNAHLQQSVLSQ